MDDRLTNRLNTRGNLQECSDTECFSDDDEDDDTFSDDTTATHTAAKKPIERIEDLSWFHGSMSRNTAEALLLTNGVEGSYLMRMSKKNPGTYTVSVRCKDSLKHYSLGYNQYTDVYSFGMGQFDNLNELIEHFNCLPVLGSTEGATVTLQFPYMNDVPEPSTYEKVVRHAEFGKTSSIIKQSASKAPDLHIASKEGFLIKRGAIHKNWKKRWFVLQKNILKYFADRKDETPIRVIDLNEADHVSEDFIDQKRNCFRLVLPTRTYYFVTSTPQDMKAWMELLNWKIEYYQDRKIDEPNSVLHCSKLISFPAVRH